MPALIDVKQIVTDNSNLNSVEQVTPKLTAVLTTSKSTVKRGLKDDQKVNSKEAGAKSETVTETNKPTISADKREDLTALKALDKLLRRYDRRSTPTNDLGKISWAKFFLLLCVRNCVKDLPKFTRHLTKSTQRLRSDM